MTPERIVAALAAVAVGFGITLVGVAFDDDAARNPDALVGTQAQGEATTAERPETTTDPDAGSPAPTELTVATPADGSGPADAPQIGEARPSCDVTETVLVVRTDDDVTVLVERLGEYAVNDGGFVFELGGDEVDTTDTARAITAEPVIAEVLQLDAPRRILVCDDGTMLSEESR